jgi:hypothetical protein
MNLLEKTNNMQNGSAQLAVWRKRGCIAAENEVGN